MPPGLRYATIDDAAALAEVHVRTWQHVYRGIVPDELLDRLSVERRTDQWRSWLSGASPEMSVLVAADNDGFVVGFVWVGRTRDDGASDETGELLAIYVLPEHQGRGIGSLLMSAGIGQLREVNFLQATLWVLEKNVAARSFYERCGWAPDGATKVEHFGDFELVEIRYRINLDHDAVPSPDPNLVPLSPR